MLITALALIVHNFSPGEPNYYFQTPTEISWQPPLAPIALDVLMPELTPGTG